MDDHHHHHHGRMLTALDLLTTPQHVTNIHGMTHPMAPIITQMIQATHGMTGGGAGSPGGGYGSKMPIWTAAYDWCTALNHTLTTLSDHTTTHIPKGDALHALDLAYALPLGPDHTTHINKAATQLEHHHRMALKLLFPPMFEITAPCPECGATHTHHQGADGNIRAAALTVHEMWAECGACGHIWDGIDVIALGRALNPPPVETVLPTAV